MLSCAISLPTATETIVVANTYNFLSDLILLCGLFFGGDGICFCLERQKNQKE
ncbi:hypothetical protein Hanom_Chr00s078787g01792661 [Helianthus anomalus]